MTIQPIETHYAGCRFRSRLEARWAVFFDHLGIRWEYEPQGYLIDGTAYLPDYWLPDLKAWAEVKGIFGTGQFDLLKRAVMPGGLPPAMHLEATSSAGLTTILLLGNLPEAGPDRAVRHSLLRAACKTNAEIVPAVRMFVFEATPKPGLFPFDIDFDVTRVSDQVATGPDAFLSSGLTPRIVPWAKVTAAYAAARSARFEHGERG